MSPGASSGMPGFHALRVKRVVRETADACSILFDVPPHLASAFGYEAGQFVTLRATIDGEALLRSYSMSSAPMVDDDLQVTVKRVPGGRMSNWVNDAVAEGDVVDVLRPAGRFVLRDTTCDIVAFAGGSGITPVFSILKTAMWRTSRRARLLYANRDAGGVIFAHDLGALRDRFGDRLCVDHHADSERGIVDDAVVATFAGDATDADVYVCGPEPFMETVERVMLRHGVPPDRIFLERFTPGDASIEEAAVAEMASEATQLTIELGGRSAILQHRAGTTILQAARFAGLRPPSSCESGNCGTCMARLVEGRVEMRANDVLTPAEVADGWILTCQSVPASASVRVVYG